DLAGETEEAFAWFRVAAALGHAGACQKVGEMYGNGVGVGRDVEKGREWLRKGGVDVDAGAAGEKEGAESGNAGPPNDVEKVEPGEWVEVKG
ncbi:hypothetical protein HK104_005229, partial [Borealophlyctis nickersoniae]